jgi:tetratricopeptide (TPR) repeat protein
VALIALIALIVIALGPAPAFGQGREAGYGAPPKGRTLRWITSVQQHESGIADDPAREIAQWPDSDVQGVVAAIRSLVTFVNRGRGVIDIDGKRYTVEGVRELFGIPLGEPPTQGANRMLHLGATFHSDIAALLPHRGVSMERSIVVRDGQNLGSTANTIHWNMGRTLLDGVLPSPEADAATLEWYQIASAQILHEGSLSQSGVHLEKAYRLFPKDPVLLLDAAYLHEELAAPGNQAGVESTYRLTGVRLAVGSKRVELEQAERWLRQTLASDAEDVTARLRLGRVVTELGRPEDAADELRRVLARDIAPRDEYLARLFRGRAEELLGHLDAARDDFRRASELFPRAQSPHLALGRIARESGDRSGLSRSLQALAALPDDERDREDPWWYYYDVH